MQKQEKLIGMGEGTYLIEIFYRDNTVDEIFMSDPICFVWRTKKQVIKIVI